MNNLYKLITKLEQELDKEKCIIELKETYQVLKKDKTIIEKVNLWIEKNKIKKIYNNIDNILLSIDYLFSIGAIDMNEEGGIYNVLNRS